MRHSIIFCFIFAANNKNNRSLSILLNTRERNKNSQFQKLRNSKEWVGFKSCSTFKWILQAIFSILSLGYVLIIYIFFPQRIFEIKFSIKFSMSHLNLFYFWNLLEVPQWSVKVRNYINFYFLSVPAVRD